jgi:hypothetical protein
MAAGVRLGVRIVGPTEIGALLLVMIGGETIADGAVVMIPRSATSAAIGKTDIP